MGKCIWVSDSGFTDEPLEHNLLGLIPVHMDHICGVQTFLFSKVPVCDSLRNVPGQRVSFFFFFPPPLDSSVRSYKVRCGMFHLAILCCF